MMDEKLAKTLAAPDFEAWRKKLWREISTQAIGEGWVPDSELTDDGVINPECDRWSSLWETLVSKISEGFESWIGIQARNLGSKLIWMLQVEIRYLFRPPVSRCVHARFRQSAKGERKVGVRFLSFHTSPHPSAEDKALFEQRRGKLHDFRCVL